MLALSLIEIKHKTRDCQVDNSFILIYQMYKEQLKEKTMNQHMRKMGTKIEENKFTDGK